METIHVFDFDGTLTKRDTLLEFIRFTKGNIPFVGGFLIHSPLLVLMKLGLYSNNKAKQNIFSFFFKGMTKEDFDIYCSSFAIEQGQKILRPKGIRTVKDILMHGDRVVILTASVSDWVQPFFGGLDVDVIGTEVEVDDSGRLTGRFTTPNCYGTEKVRRFLESYPDRKNYHLVAYGDSKGDKPILDLADESFYKPFR